MKIKSLALVAAAVTMAGAAQAADLNKPAKVAVDYVKVCDAYGAGFFYIPGSDTCLQISGYARYTGIVGSGRNLSTVAGSPYYLGGFGSARTGNNFVSKVETELDFDARTNTSYGLLRSYISLEDDYNTVVNGGAASNTINLNRGYVQWGGLTAGHVESFFTTPIQGYNDELYFSELAPDFQTNALAYTFSFGNGVTSTISIEDSTVGNGRTANSAVIAGGTDFAYQGNKIPDIVANINVTQAWGDAQISGVAHQVYGTGNGVNVNRYGYAVVGGIEFNLPTLGAGDKIAVQGAYAQGAFGYTSAGEILTNFNPNGAAGALGSDVAVTNAGLVKLGTTYTVFGAFTHTFTPTVSLALAGGFQGEQNYALDGSKLSATVATVGSSLYWTPVKGILVAFDLEYQNASFSGNTKNVLAVRNGDAIIGGLRFKRSF
jgi:hypothetical protein